jgi:uncharacterized protein DUF6292
VVTTLLDQPQHDQHTVDRLLRAYLAEVCAALGVGLESIAVDLDAPVSAYLALDCRLPGHPDRDVALLWDERHGWAAAIETHSGEDLIVVAYLGGRTVLPPADQVARFVTALVRGARPGPPDPPAIRPATGIEDLVRQLWSRP